MTSEPQVLERTFSPWRVRFHVVLGVLCWAPGPVAGLFFALGFARPIERAVWPWLQTVTAFPAVAAWTTAIAILASPIVLQATLLTYARRRYARAALDPEGASITTALAEPGEGPGNARVRWADVRSWTVREGAVVLDDGRSLWRRLDCPLVIPVASPAEERLVLACLEPASARA